MRSNTLRVVDLFATDVSRPMHDRARMTQSLSGWWKMLDAQGELSSREQRLRTIIETADADQAVRISVVAMKEGEVAPWRVVAEIACGFVRERTAAVFRQLSRQVSDLLVG